MSNRYSINRTFAHNRVPRSKISVLLVLWLFFSFLIQPFHQVFAESDVAKNITIKQDDSISKKTAKDTKLTKNNIIDDNNDKSPPAEDNGISEGQKDNLSNDTEVPLSSYTDVDKNMSASSSVIESNLSKNEEIVSTAVLGDKSNHKIIGDISTTSEAVEGGGNFLQTATNTKDNNQILEKKSSTSSSKYNIDTVKPNAVTDNSASSSTTDVIASTTAGTSVDIDYSATDNSTTTINNKPTKKSFQLSETIDETVATDTDKTQNNQTTDNKDRNSATTSLAKFDFTKKNKSTGNKSLSESDDKKDKLKLNSLEENLTLADDLNNSDSDSNDGADKGSGINDSENTQVSNVTNNDDNYYQFSRNDCVLVREGVYNCSKVDELLPNNDKTTLALSSPSIYAKLGKSGNLEIFIKDVEGKVKQITNNTVDDNFPDYDKESEKIVWQRLIDGRHQIVLFDLKTETETVLTNSKFNNIEPKISGNRVVWQSWDGSDWEISLYDNNKNNKIKVITDNKMQDVAPNINNEYVIWTVLGQGKKYAKVYSIKSNKILDINNYEGGVVTNPRFVLVYDVKFNNGDTITQTFNPKTGISQAVSANTKREPIDLPKSEPTGETKALIQNKVNNKGETEEGDLETDDDGIDSGNILDKTASSTDDTHDISDSTDNSVIKDESLDLNDTLKATTSALKSITSDSKTLDLRSTSSDKKISLSDEADKYDLVIIGSTTTESTTSANKTLFSDR